MNHSNLCISAFKACTFVAIIFTLACRPSAGPDAADSPAGSPLAQQPEVQNWFQDETQQRGIQFQHVDGRTGARFYVETAASGGGFWDYDDDGDLDIYLINGAPTPGSPPMTPPRNALFENREGQFVDVTEAAGLGDRGFGMGMCIGDADGDGLTDLFVTNYGKHALYRNLGGGRFEDWTDKAGLSDSSWGTSCAFGDIDGDGDLDLYVANYVDFRFDKNPVCGDVARGLNAYCRPTAFNGQRDFLYINQGGGRFIEEGEKRGIDQGTQGKGFGALFSDVDWDGDLDLLVANDGTMNRFYENQGNGFFLDRSLESGLGYNASGLAESGMGMELGDVDGDGLFDLIVTNYSFETNTLYLQRANGIWEDVTIASGLSGPTYQPVGWGTAFFDADNDGDLDLAFANGHVMDNISAFEPHLSYPQANMLLINQGKGTFTDETGTLAPGLLEKRVSRGLAVGDVNGDGRLDLLFTNTNDQPNLFLNHCQQPGAWLIIRLRGEKSNKAAIGAKLRLSLEDGTLLGVREVRSGGSFLAQHSLDQHFGLGIHQGPFFLEVHWPNGTIYRQEGLLANQYHLISYTQPQ